MSSNAPKHLTVIAREGVPEVLEWDDYLDAVSYYDSASMQWTESFLCKVVAGPGMPLPAEDIKRAWLKEHSNGR